MIQFLICIYQNRHIKRSFHWMALKTTKWREPWHFVCRGLRLLNRRKQMYVASVQTYLATDHLSCQISSQPKTRPISPISVGSVLGREMGPRKFQGNLGWWYIIYYHLARFTICRYDHTLRIDLDPSNGLIESLICLSPESEVDESGNFLDF